MPMTLTDIYGGTDGMTPHEKLAGEYFLAGAVCSQAVFCAFSDLTGLDTDTAARLSSSLGGGVGRLREVCGAFSGVAMAAGLIYGFGMPVLRDEKKEHYARIQLLAEEFRRNLGSVVCRDLLSDVPGALSGSPEPDARTPEFYMSRPCLKAVCTAARILDRYIALNPPENKPGNNT